MTFFQREKKEKFLGYGIAFVSTILMAIGSTSVSAQGAAGNGIPAVHSPIKSTSPSSTDCLITENSIGKVRIGMTYRQVATENHGSLLKYEEDGEGRIYMALYRPKEDSSLLTMSFDKGFDEAKKLPLQTAKVSYIYTGSEHCRTKDNVGPTSLLSQVSKVYGGLKIILSPLDGDVEDAFFFKQPKTWIFKAYGGIYGAKSSIKDGRKTTKKYKGDAVITGIEVSAVQ